MTYRTPDPRIKIGTTFYMRGKTPKVCTVTDILTTTNSKGEVVDIRFVAVHEFMGQQIEDNNVIDNSILMRLIEF